MTIKSNRFITPLSYKMLLVLLIAVFFTVSCPTAWAKEEIIVSAAASLTNVMKAVGVKFEGKNQGVTVIFNFAASGALLQQMINGAPVDVFASADQESMNRVEEKNLILRNTRKNFVRNRLALITPANSRLKIKSITDLTLSTVARVALGNSDTVPAGRYAQTALKDAGMWEKLSGKFIYAGTVRQVLDYVSRGEVDAGFVYSTDAVLAGERIKTVAEVKTQTPIIYPIAVTAATRKSVLSKRFVDFVFSDSAQQIFVQYGFGKI